ncbi:MAG: hypothetical protein V4659_06610 [Pseudomonadota bacterium]
MTGSIAGPSTIVSNNTVGIEVNQPAGWTVLTAEANAANLRSVQPENKDLQEAFAKYASAPVIAFTKYAEPYADLNPSFKVNLRPVGQLAGRSASEILTVVIPALRYAFSDLRIDQEPVSTTVGGRAAAYARFTYTLAARGQKFATTSELWIVPRGSYFFMIGAGTRHDEANGTRAEIQSILSTVKIDAQE